MRRSVTHYINHTKWPRCRGALSANLALYCKEDSQRRSITKRTVDDALLHTTLLWRGQPIRRSITYHVCRDSTTYHAAVALLHTTLLWRDQPIRRPILYSCQWLLRRFFGLVDLRSLFINCTLVVGSTTRSFDMNIWLVVQLNCTSMKSRKSSQQSLTKKRNLLQFLYYTSADALRQRENLQSQCLSKIHSFYTI